MKALIERVEAGQVKALSIKQPYPHHIFHDGKDVENRDWPTRGRGWFIIHAGVSKSECSPSQYDLPRGGVVGVARIVPVCKDCHQGTNGIHGIGHEGLWCDRVGVDTAAIATRLRAESVEIGILPKGSR